MKPLQIEESEFTPKIFFDVDNHYLEISGFSRPEDVRGFYQGFFDWLEVNKSEIYSNLIPSKKLKIDFKLIYFNSASSKCLLDMIVSLNKLYSQQIEVTWYYDEGDEDLLEAGEEFSDAVELPFSYIEVKEE